MYKWPSRASDLAAGAFIFNELGGGGGDRDLALIHILSLGKCSTCTEVEKTLT